MKASRLGMIVGTIILIPFVLDIPKKVPATPEQARQQVLNKGFYEAEIESVLDGLVILRVGGCRVKFHAEGANNSSATVVYDKKGKLILNSRSLGTNALSRAELQARPTTAPCFP